MYYTLNKNNKITATANYKFQPDAVYTDEEVVYDYNGQLVFKHETESEEYKAAASVHEKLKLKEDLRFRRETECIYGNKPRVFMVRYFNRRAEG